MEDALSAVLDGGEPRRLRIQLGALHIGLILTVDVSRHRLEPSEPEQGHDLAETMNLNDGIDPVEDRRRSPHRFRQRPGVEVRIDGHIFPIPWLSRDQRVELDLLDGAQVGL